MIFIAVQGNNATNIGNLSRQYRTKIVVQTRSELFRQIVQNDAGIPAYFKEFWAKMTEKLQAYARQSAQRGLFAVLPIIIHSI